MMPNTSEFVTRMLYDRGYGIFDHEAAGNTRPLSPVAMFDAEDAVEGGYLFNVIRTFHRYKVAKEFGITLLDFLELPQHVTNLMVDMASMAMRIKSKEASDISASLDSELD